MARKKKVSQPSVDEGVSQTNNDNVGEGVTESRGSAKELKEKESEQDDDEQ